MKKIKTVNSAENPDKSSVFIQRRKYTFHVGNGVIATLSSAEKLAKYKTECENQVNEIGQNLSTFCGLLYVEFRGLFFLLPDHLQNKLSDSFRAVDASFARALGQRMSRNKNHFNFSHLRNIVASLKSICGLMVDFATNKKYYSYVNRLRALNSMVGALGEKLEVVGMASPLLYSVTLINQISAPDPRW